MLISELDLCPQTNEALAEAGLSAATVAGIVKDRGAREPDQLRVLGEQLNIPGPALVEILRRQDAIDCAY